MHTTPIPTPEPLENDQITYPPSTHANNSNPVLSGL